MGKYDGILICSDFDGTFASNSVIVPENAEAVRRFQEEGGMFTLSTGRSHHHFTSYRDIFHPNVPMLCYNGSVLYDPDSDQVLYEGYMDESICDDMKTLLEVAPEIVDMHLCANGAEITIRTNEYDPDIAREWIRKNPIYKILTYMQAEDCDAVTERVRASLGNTYGIYRSWYYGIEIQSLKDTKGQGILRLKKHLGDRVKTVIACGDYENDLSMFDVADISFAPANAHPDVKAKATRVTVDCSEGAIAKIISEL